VEVVLVAQSQEPQSHTQHTSYRLEQQQRTPLSYTNRSSFFVLQIPILHDFRSTWVRIDKTQRLATPRHADTLLGVPKFFRWMSERYPAISQLIAENRIPEFDALYVRD